MYFSITLSIMITVMSILGIWEIVDRICNAINYAKQKAYNEGYADACNGELPF